MENKQLSKFLSLILRHKPEVIGIELDHEGWADLDELITKLNLKGKNVDLAQIGKVVTTNDKQRFKLDLEHRRIRANQGHSIDVNLALPALTPPQYLYHGTATRFLTSILKEGLQKRSRQHVHLSDNRDTALKVGQRHGKAVILIIEAGRMFEDGKEFFRSENGVWLTDTVPVEYLAQE